MKQACTFLRTGLSTVRSGRTVRTVRPARFSRHHMVDEPYVRFGRRDPSAKTAVVLVGTARPMPAIAARDPKWCITTVLAPGGAMEHSSSSRRLAGAAPPIRERTYMSTYVVRTTVCT